MIDQGGTWFFNDQEKSVAYILAKEGYDIWVGNNRGTTNSWLHVDLTVEDSAYWNYTFHELGVHDQPTFQKEVLKQTGKD